jgi:hypothetical protein
LAWRWFVADSQVSQYRREQEQTERYMSADDLDACFEPDEEPAESEEDDREPDYDYVPLEESQSYRESMVDAGRGHLLR